MPAFDLVRLRTERLMLRPLHDADADALLAIFSDARVMRYWSTPPWASIAKAHSVIDTDREALAAGQHLRLGLERTDDHALIGTCTLFNLNAQCRRAELGYGMDPAAWGKGYMHEALLALLGHGFRELDLNRVEADIDAGNLASARSLERLGFTCEG